MTGGGRELEVAQVWQGYWEDHQDEIPAWDTLSQLILGRLEVELDPLAGKSVCEAGCGSGRISQRLHQAGADVTCLDISKKALELSRRAIGNDERAHYVEGSILSMPKQSQFDAIWNAGVLEHFKPEQQRTALQQFGSVLKPGGRAIILTPYKWSLPYRVAKWRMERSASWPYGPEVPVSTLRDVTPRNLLLKVEYTVTFLPFFLDADKIAKGAAPICRMLRKAASRFDTKTLMRIDRVLSGTLGGYLLVSVFERPRPSQRRMRHHG